MEKRQAAESKGKNYWFQVNNRNTRKKWGRRSGVFTVHFEHISSLFFVWVFFHEHSRITVLQGKGEGIPLTPQYHFHPLHRHLDISREFTAESSHLHVASKPVSNRKPLASERK